MDYEFLGWSIIVLGVVLLGPYLLFQVNKKFLKTKNKNFTQFLKFLRKVHKPLALVLLVIPPIHAYLALGTLRLHTGTFVYLSMILTATFGALFFSTKKKIYLKCHRYCVILIIITLSIHLLFPGLIS